MHSLQIQKPAALHLHRIRYRLLSVSSIRRGTCTWALVHHHVSRYVHLCNVVSGLCPHTHGSPSNQPASLAGFRVAQVTQATQELNVMD